MHYPRCLDPATQNAPPDRPVWEHGCLLGRPGHCAKCPHRGQRDPRVLELSRASSYLPDYDRPDSRRPDTEFSNGPMPQEIAEFLWPPSEREWIERDNRWGERAHYHVAMARSALISELLREIHDLRQGAA